MNVRLRLGVNTTTGSSVVRFQCRLKRAESKSTIKKNFSSAELDCAFMLLQVQVVQFGGSCSLLVFRRAVKR